MWRMLFGPAVRLMNRFTFVHKFFLIGALFVLPLAVLSWGLINEINQRMDYSRAEQRGLALVGDVYPLLAAALEYRDVAIIQRIDSRPEVMARITQSRAEVDRQLQHLLRQVMQNGNGDLSEVQQLLLLLALQWQQLNQQSAGGQGDIGLQLGYYDKFVDQIGRLLDNILHVSKLVHDPDLETFFLIRQLTRQLPETLQLAARLRAVGSYALGMSRIDSHTQELITRLETQIRNQRQQWHDNFLYDLNGSSLLTPELLAASEEFMAQVESAEQYFYEVLIESVNLSVPWQEYFARQSHHLALAIDYARPLGQAIDGQLRQRIRDAQLKLALLLISSFVMFSLIAYIASGLYFSLDNTIASFSRNAERVASGDLRVTMPVGIDDEMARLARAFNRMTGELQNNRRQLVEADKMATLGSLLAGISHELNTPLGVAVTSATLLGDALDDVSERFEQQRLRQQDITRLVQQGRESLALMQSSLDKLNHLVGLFNMLSVDEGNVNFRRFALAPVLAGLPQRAAGEEINLDEVRLDVYCDDDLMLSSEPELLQMSLLILLKNAVGHAFGDVAEPVLEIRAWREAEGVNIRVSDNGRGIDATQLRHIFEPFYTTKRASGAVGLGLHILYNLVTQTLKGRISCHSELGRGSDFVIRLPAETD